MDCAKECCKEESFKELFLKINSHSERIVAMEVKLQMILWGIALVAGLVIGNIVTTISTSKERVDRIYYSTNQSSESQP
jgi:hypothetical protein